MDHMQHYLRFGSDVVDKSRNVTQKCVIMRVALQHPGGEDQVSTVKYSTVQYSTVQYIDCQVRRDSRSRLYCTVLYCTVGQEGLQVPAVQTLGQLRGPLCGHHQPTGADDVRKIVL